MQAAGYQSPTSILTRAMVGLCDELRSHGGPYADLNWLDNVTAQGETAASLFQSVEHGQRQLCYMASGYLSHRVPELSVLDLPFAHPDRSALTARLDGKAGGMLCQAIERQSAYHCLGFWDNGLRHISNALRALHSPADARGMAIRTLDSALYRDSLHAMGFAARTCDVKDLVQWVSQGVVQAQENPLTNLLGFELWRHHPHVSLTAHFQGVLLVLCPRAWYDGLSPRARDQLAQAVEHVTREQRLWAVQEDQRALTELPGHGVQVLSATDLDLAAFHAATDRVRKKACASLAPELIRALGLS